MVRLLSGVPAVPLGGSQRRRRPIHTCVVSRDSGCRNEPEHGQAPRQLAACPAGQQPGYLRWRTRPATRCGPAAGARPRSLTDTAWAADAPLCDHAYSAGRHTGLKIGSCSLTGAGRCPVRKYLPFGMKRWASAFTGRGAQVRPIWFIMVSRDGLRRLEPQCDGLRNLPRAGRMPMPQPAACCRRPEGRSWLALRRCCPAGRDAALVMSSARAARRWFVPGRTGRRAWLPSVAEPGACLRLAARGDGVTSPRSRPVPRRRPCLPRPR